MSWWVHESRIARPGAQYRAILHCEAIHCWSWWEATGRTQQHWVACPGIFKHVGLNWDRGDMSGWDSRRQWGSRIHSQPPQVRSVFGLFTQWHSSNPLVRLLSQDPSIQLFYPLLIMPAGQWPVEWSPRSSHRGHSDRAPPPRWRRLVKCPRGCWVQTIRQVLRAVLLCFSPP